MMTLAKKPNDITLRLYHNAMSTCAQKVRFVLAAKGVEWDSRHLNLRNGEQHRTEYLRLNPAGVVPTLTSGSDVVVESSVICEFLDDLYPTPPLRPAGAAGRAEMRLWLKLIDTSIHAHAGVVSNAIAFRFQKLEKGEQAARALVENIPDPAKRERMRSIVFEGTDSPIFAESFRAMHRFTEKMEVALSQRRFLVDETLTIADAACLPYVVRMKQLGMAEAWGRDSALAKWLDGITRGAAFQSAYTDWEDASYLDIMRRKGAQYWPGIRKNLM